MPMPTALAVRIETEKIGQRAAAHQAELAKMLPLWPHELSDVSAEGRMRRLALLQKALRAERRRGLAGHWTYDLGRHSALLRCYKRELELDQAASAASPAWHRRASAT